MRAFRPRTEWPAIFRTPGALARNASVSLKDHGRRSVSVMEWFGICTTLARHIHYDHWSGSKTHLHPLPPMSRYGSATREDPFVKSGTQAADFEHEACVLAAGEDKDRSPAFGGIKKTLPNVQLQHGSVRVNTPMMRPRMSPSSSNDDSAHCND